MAAATSGNDGNFVLYRRICADQKVRPEMGFQEVRVCGRKASHGFSSTTVSAELMSIFRGAAYRVSSTRRTAHRRE
jgi:hypothetical protein